MEGEEMKKRYVVTALILLLLGCVAFDLEPILAPSYMDVTKRVEVVAPAVKMTEAGLEGVISYITVEVGPGSGHVFVDTMPLTNLDTQASARLAAEVAEEVTGFDMEKHDVFITVRSEAPVIGGPSAGGVIAVALIAALLDLKVDPKVMMTGTINPDGSIGPVGGILEKAEAAAKAGATLFLVPEGQLVVTQQQTRKEKIGPIVQIITQPVTIDVGSYAWERWGLKVEEVRTAREAVEKMTHQTLPKPRIHAKPVETARYKLIMSQLANSVIENAESMVSEVETLLEEASVDPFTYKNLLGLLEEQKTKLEEARSVYNQEQYYSSSSLAFQVSIDTSIIAEKLRYIQSRRKDLFLEELINSAEKEIEEARLFIQSEKTKIDNASALQCLGAAEKRVGEAKRRLKDAWRSYYSREPIKSLEYAVISRERAKTARWWMGLAKNFVGTGKPIDEEKLAEIAQLRLADARSSLAYTETILEEGNPILQEAFRKVDDAEKEYEAGNYAAALFDAIDARVTANTSLELRGITDENLDQLDPRIETAISRASEEIENSRRLGVEPILAVSYVEWAKYLRNKNPVVAYQIAKYARECADISESLVKVFGGTKVVTPPETAKPKKQGQNMETRKTPVAQHKKEWWVYTTLIAVPIIVVILVGYGFSRKKKVLGARAPGAEATPAEIEQFLDRLDTQLLEGKISEEEYHTLRDAYERKLLGWEERNEGSSFNISS